jgi:hypothetical protein
MWLSITRSVTEMPEPQTSSWRRSRVRTRPRWRTKRGQELELRGRGVEAAAVAAQLEAREVELTGAETVDFFGGLGSGAANGLDSVACHRNGVALRLEVAFESERDARSSSTIRILTIRAPFSGPTAGGESQVSQG